MCVHRNYWISRTRRYRGIRAIDGPIKFIIIQFEVLHICVLYINYILNKYMLF